MSEPKWRSLGGHGIARTEGFPENDRRLWADECLDDLNRLAAAEEREKTVAPGHAVLAKAIADAREETMQVKTRLAAAEDALREIVKRYEPHSRSLRGM